MYGCGTCQCAWVRSLGGGVAHGATHVLRACSASTQVDGLTTKHQGLPSPESWQPHALATFTSPLMQVVSSDVQKQPAPGAGWGGGEGVASVGNSMESRAISQRQLRLQASLVAAALPPGYARAVGALGKV